jgi:hypothetical protein
MSGSSEAFRAQQDRDQIGEKAERSGAGEPEIEGHRSGLVAEAGIAERRRHQSEDEADPEKVLHLAVST